MPGFFLECYTGLKWVKRKYLSTQILNLSQPKIESAKSALLTGPKIQMKFPGHSGDCVLGDVQLYALFLIAKGWGIYIIAWY